MLVLPAFLVRLQRSAGSATARHDAPTLVADRRHPGCWPTSTEPQSVGAPLARVRRWSDSSAQGRSRSWTSSRSGASLLRRTHRVPTTRCGSCPARRSDLVRACLRSGRARGLSGGYRWCPDQRQSCLRRDDEHVRGLRIHPRAGDGRPKRRPAALADATVADRSTSCGSAENGTTPHQGKLTTNLSSQGSPESDGGSGRAAHAYG